jgi:hypothetical protein
MEDSVPFLYESPAPPSDICEDLRAKLNRCLCLLRAIDFGELLSALPEEEEEQERHETGLAVLQAVLDEIIKADRIAENLAAALLREAAGGRVSAPPKRTRKKAVESETSPTPDPSDDASTPPDSQS